MSLPSAAAKRPAPALPFLAAGGRRRLFPYLLVAPVVLLVAIGVLYPVGYVVYLSLQSYLPFRGNAVEFIGDANYIKLLQDADFWNSLQVSVIWVVGSVVPQFLLGLLMALLLNERFPGRGAVRTIILLPWVVSGVITAIIWVWLFDGTVGVTNDLLMKANLVQSPIAWAIQPATTWFMVLVANAWRGAPFFAIVLLAALQSIPPDLYEAAKIDGADRWERFRHVTLPLIFNAIIVATLLRSLWTFNFIDLIWTMTHGGPVSATRTLPIHIFDVAYQRGDFGYAAALSTVLCVVLLLFSGLYWQLNRFGHEE